MILLRALFARSGSGIGAAAGTTTGSLQLDGFDIQLDGVSLILS